MRKEDAKRLQGARIFFFSKNEEMAWAHHQETSRTGLIGKRREVRKNA